MPNLCHFRQKVRGKKKLVARRCTAETFHRAAGWVGVEERYPPRQTSKVGSFSTQTRTYVTPNVFEYRGTSLIRKRHPVGPYSRVMPRALWWS